MDASFWHKKWENNDIGFHQGQINAFLLTHFQTFMPPPARVFVPLCGKTRDIHWLLEKGYHVAGAELSTMAIEALFEQMQLTPDITADGLLTRYSAPGIDIFGGDFFALGADQLGKVDAIYDRAAIVALPSDTRGHYATHLQRITCTAPQLLIAYEYDQSRIDGPPFSVSAAELDQHYAENFTLNRLEQRQVEGGMKGQVPAVESCWSLMPIRRS